MEGNNQAPNDIENQYTPLVTSMREVLDSLLPPLSSDSCIYRIPEQLRCINEKAYTPQVVSIGPLHHGKEALKAMEEHKNRYLRDFLHRTKISIEGYVKKIKDQESRLRSYYAETIKFNSDEFVRIILVDAAFIIELFLKNRFDDLVNENDHIFDKRWITHALFPDMLMLENQLPFFILEDLFPEKITISFNSNDSIEGLSLINLLYNCLKDALRIEGVEGNLERICSSKVEHIVDLIRSLYLPLESQEAGGELKALHTPSITELHHAGVKFKVGSTKNFFDIRFTDGILEIPKLRICNETELLFRNVVAYEQCHCKETYISDFVSLIGLFVKTSADLELLVEQGICEIMSSTSETCTLLNNLGKGVILCCSDFYFATICEDLNKYCRTTWNIWKANLRHNYFNTPWATVSVIGAVSLLILTLIQTVCSIISILLN